MAGDNGCGEHLFSLELLVESARVEPQLLPMPLTDSAPFRPAVALRLLDFPTLLVRAPQAAPGPVVPFGRGKSCLFRLPPDALKNLLQRSPLHALLLALPPNPGPARLLGSSSVSLAAAAEELLLGSGPGGGTGHFPLRDLMGKPVGELEMSYRLNSLGSSGLKQLGPGAAEAEALVGKKPHQQLTRPTGRAAEQMPSLEFISEGEEGQDPAPGGGSQRSLSSPDSEPESFSSSSSSSREEITGELEINTNPFCPPPMYYSHQTGKCCPSPKPAARVIIVTTQDSLAKQGTSLPFIKEEPVIYTENASLPSTLGSSEQLRQTLCQLPLLNALLVELSLLNSRPLPPGPSTVHPQLAWLYQNVEGGTKAPPSNGKNMCTCRDDKKNTPHRKERGRSPSPKLKRNRPDHVKGISPICAGKTFTKPVYIERPASPEKINTKENSPPRRKLTYGVTNTLRLRLQQPNPGMLKIHEKREHCRKKPGDTSFEKKGKSSSAKGKTFRGSPDYHLKSSGQCDEKSIPDQNAQINENVETLIQSSADRNSPMTTKKISSHVPRKAGASGVKSRDRAKGKYSPGMVDSNYKGNLEVHLPRIFLQDTEGLENPIDTEIGKCVPHNCNISYIYKHRQISNFEKSHAHKNSDSVVVNSKNAAYSEDFTSIDSCGTSLEAPESSPKPLPINADHSQSGIDFNSNNSRSLPAKCISPLLPIPSPVSPAQTLKKTFDIKSNEKQLGIGLNKFDDSLARTLRDQLTVYEKERRKVTQTFEDKQVHPDTNCNIAQNKSSGEKSHTVRTSQVSSYLPSSVSDLELSGLEESKVPDKEKEDSFGTMDVTNQCKHVSELVINKLPGYTM